MTNDAHQLPLFAPTPPPPLSDDPLSEAELVTLSRMGWEFPRHSALADGTPLVTMRFERRGEWEYGEELRRTPGGWRMLIREMERDS